MYLCCVRELIPHLLQIIPHFGYKPPADDCSAPREADLRNL